jgi:chemotaxis protein CheC
MGAPMPPDDVRALSAQQLDALREVANIGAGHAATALSQITGERIMISVPELSIAPLDEIPTRWRPRRSRWPRC